MTTAIYAYANMYPYIFDVPVIKYQKYFRIIKIANKIVSLTKISEDYYRKLKIYYLFLVAT